MKSMWKICLVVLCCIRLLSASPVSFAVAPQADTDVVRISTSQAAIHQIEIDDAPAFRTPIVRRKFEGTSLELHGNEVGLIPGVKYYVRLDGVPETQELILALPAPASPESGCVVLRQSWNTYGRKIVGDNSGLRWEPGNSKWVVVPHGPIGQSLYYAGFYLRPALNAARACEDRTLLDEIAQYYLVMLSQTEQLGTLLARPDAASITKERMQLANSSARTFAAAIGNKVGESELANAQWLYPAARLLRLITLIPDAERSAVQKNFAADYTPFLVNEQLDRFLFQQKLLALGVFGRSVARVELWNAAMRGFKGRQTWDTAMSDIDLWLLAEVAEVLGANANDPALVPLDLRQTSQLHLAMHAGIDFFQSKRTEYPDTKNFLGQTVGSASYFNGDYAAHPDYDYSAAISEQIPTPAQKGSLKDASWDVSHVYRLPVFLRALYENRKATGANFPKFNDLTLVANQYVYRVFNGDFTRPLFHNYFDGSDGWHRVGYHGGNFGYPPSPYCDMHNGNRPCLSPGNIIAWGQLAFASPDLARLQEALLSLARDNRPEMRSFRDRYYFYDQPFQVLTDSGQNIYGNGLYVLIADNEEWLVIRSGARATSQAQRRH